MLLASILQTAAAGAVAEAVPVQQELSFSLIDMALKGGWLTFKRLLRCNPFYKGDLYDPVP